MAVRSIGTPSSTARRGCGRWWDCSPAPGWSRWLSNALTHNAVQMFAGLEKCWVTVTFAATFYILIPVTGSGEFATYHPVMDISDLSLGHVAQCAAARYGSTIAHPSQLTGEQKIL